nr:HAD hydrolase family protein [Muribaculum intestinale]
MAVENALPEVKAAAEVVIGTNDTDAVARFIESDFMTDCYAKN